MFTMITEIKLGTQIGSEFGGVPIKKKMLTFFFFLMSKTRLSAKTPLM